MKKKHITLIQKFPETGIKPQIDDYIYISNELLNPRYSGYSTSYTFGNLDSKYGKESINLVDIDVIRIITNEKRNIFKTIIWLECKNLLDK